MEEQNINEIHRKVSLFLQEERLKQSIDALGENIDELSDWDLRTRYEEIKTAYNYLLEYLSQGFPDPERNRMHNELIGKCFILNDEIAISRKAEKLFNIYSQYRRKYKNIINDGNIRLRMIENTANQSVLSLLPVTERKVAEKSLKEEHERLLSEIFYRILCSTNWKRNECEYITTLLIDEEININDRATAISALFLGALKYFEPNKALILCHLSNHNEGEIAIRALIGLLMLLFIYSNRIKYYPELLATLQTLKENAIIEKRIQTIQIQLFRCRETKEIDRKMREEIIPAMMKNPHLSSSKIGMDIIKEIEEDEQNPEWKAWLEQDNIKNKIEEMTKWQTEGADVYMSTFSQLKRYPFFNEMFNWLRPFDPESPQISEIIPAENAGSKSLLGAICSSRFFCNSDKYSFCFTLNQVPKEQRDMLMQQISNDKDAASEGPETETTVPKEKDVELQGNQYIQDLYRFFKLSNYRNEFDDPFLLSLNILEQEPIAFLLDRDSAAIQVFNYLIEKEYYNEAYNIGVMCEASENKNNIDALFYQKMGYSLQKQSNYKKAIDYFTKADIIKPDTLWTLRHIAQCYRLSGEYNKALYYYDAAEQLAPENLTLMMQKGESLVGVKRYDEALALFFKIDYLEKDSIRAWRAIAWCSFLIGKDEQAHKYYEKILGTPKANSEDYLNAGHVEWINNNKKQAIELYKKAKNICVNSEDIIVMIFNDKDILLSRGMEYYELILLRDILI